MQAMYANGAKGYFDALGHHPYCFPAAPGDAQNWSGWYQMYGPSNSLRATMTANGDGGKKIWATEFGYRRTAPRERTCRRRSRPVHDEGLCALRLL